MDSRCPRLCMPIIQALPPTIPRAQPYSVYPLIFWFVLSVVSDDSWKGKWISWKYHYELSTLLVLSVRISCYINSSWNYYDPTAGMKWFYPTFYQIKVRLFGYDVLSEEDDKSIIINNNHGQFIKDING